MQAAEEHYLSAWKRVLWDATGDQTKVDRIFQLADLNGLFDPARAALLATGRLAQSAARISELDDANNACIEFAAKHGYATGHGDTVGDMIREFSAQIPSVAQAAPEPDADIKLVYVKRWRTIVRLPAKYADEIVEALRSSPVSSTEPVASDA